MYDKQVRQLTINKYNHEKPQHDIQQIKQIDYNSVIEMTPSLYKQNINQKIRKKPLNEKMKFSNLRVKNNDMIN